MQERIKEHDIDIRFARFWKTLMKRGIFPFIDRYPHWYKRRVKEAIHIRLNPTTSIAIVESQFLKLGYLPSKHTTADQQQSGPMREEHLTVGIITRIEMHQLAANVNNRPHRLMNTGSIAVETSRRNCLCSFSYDCF